jgi:predicted RNase H-like HicB family nuclease
VLSYPVRVTPLDDHLVVVTFHDLPEAVIVAADEEDAFGRAQQVLETVLGGYVLEGRSIPTPTDVCGAPTVTTEQYTTLGFDVRL